MTLAAVAVPWPVRHRGFLAGVVILAVVLAATGWPMSIGVWVLALILIPASAYVAMIALIPGFVILLPLRAILDRGSAPWCKTAAHLTVPVGKGLIAVGCYLITFDLENVAEVRLPFESANASALAIMFAAVVAWMVAAGRVEEAKAWLKEAVTPPPPRPDPPTRTPSRLLDLLERPLEPEETYWSAEPVVVWRSWAWDGFVLNGFLVEWSTPTLTAVCPQCPTAPSWSHTCGIYGVKDLDDTPLRPGGLAYVEGRVEMWGDVIEHELGYRASHARIIDLWTHPEVVDDVRERYPTVEVHAWPIERSLYD